MVFVIPGPGRDLPENRFEFQLEPGDGEVLSLPKMEYLPRAVDKYLKSIEGTTLPLHEYVLGVIDATDPELGELVRGAELERDQITALHVAWKAASEVDEGKSSGSSQS